jgi:asparagine synthase (glutamine-hydrolysing)
MGDFLVDFRKEEERRMTPAASFLRFFDDMHVTLIEEREFSLLLTSPDDPRLWGPFRSQDGRVLVALCGRVALEQKDWDEAQQIQGEGGLACKFIYKCYRDGGIDCAAKLSGNFVILIIDRTKRSFRLVTDPWGLAPAFRHETSANPVFSSHPDALADAVGQSRGWDITSFAEFILTGRLSWPFTYYQRVKSLPRASITTVSLDEQRVEATKLYFQFQFNPHPEEKIEDLAEELASGFRRSLTKRSAAAVGKSAVALSGGLDSRTILCAAPRRDNLITFTCYDRENEEFRTARDIARAAGVEFVPMRRSADYYADNAALGVKISAGMGCIASNHFLGFRKDLKSLGVDNLLTGCYCDYLFKGLALNKRVNRFTMRESVGDFSFSYYARHFVSGTKLDLAVRERLEEQFPRDLQRYDTEARLVDVEQRRMFPLCYEEDNAERTIPQRVMGWYVPVAENDLLSVQQKMTSAMKLNRRLFALMVAQVCAPRISQIRDANTGAPVESSAMRRAFSHHLRRAGDLWRKLSASPAASGSWMNWNFYIGHSEKVRSLWSAPNPDAMEIFRQILGREGFSSDVHAYQNGRLGIFLQLFTLKVWLDQRRG